MFTIVISEISEAQHQCTKGTCTTAARLRVLGRNLTTRNTLKDNINLPVAPPASALTICIHLVTCIQSDKSCTDTRFQMLVSFAAWIALWVLEHYLILSHRRLTLVKNGVKLIGLCRIRNHEVRIPRAGVGHSSAGGGDDVATTISPLSNTLNLDHHHHENNNNPPITHAGSLGVKPPPPTSTSRRTPTPPRPPPGRAPGRLPNKPMLPTPRQFAHNAPKLPVAERFHRARGGNNHDGLARKLLRSAIRPRNLSNRTVWKTARAIPEPRAEGAAGRRTGHEYRRCVGVCRLSVTYAGEGTTEDHLVCRWLVQYWR